MLDIIRKREYFEWCDRGIVAKGAHNLKHVQDAWVLALLGDWRGKRIAEVGGGLSRVLDVLKKHNECWNIDKFEGAGNGPEGLPKVPGVTIVPAYLGEFDRRLADGYFDAVFSVSVVEHVQIEQLPEFFRDCARILRPGGLLLHAIDLYVRDEPHGNERVDAYRDLPGRLGLPLEWVEPPAIDGRVTFRCEYASNSDATMARWNVMAPGLRGVREVAQSVSVKAAWRKRGAE